MERPGLVRHCTDYHCAHLKATREKKALSPYSRYERGSSARWRSSHWAQSASRCEPRIRSSSSRSTSNPVGSTGAAQTAPERPGSRTTAVSPSTSRRASRSNLAEHDARSRVAAVSTCTPAAWIPCLRPRPTAAPAGSSTWRPCCRTTTKVDGDTSPSLGQPAGRGSQADRHWLARVQVNAQRRPNAPSATIDFRRGADGTGRVIVQLTDPRTPVNVRQEAIRSSSTSPAR